MASHYMPLAIVRPGEEVTIVDIRAGRELTRRLSDMGLTPETTIRVINSHTPGPVLIDLSGSRLVIGFGVDQEIMVELKKDAHGN